MGWLEKGAAAIGRGLWRIAIALVAVGIVIGTFTYLGNNQAQLNNVVQSGGDFASTGAITTLDWATAKMGGDAAHEGTVSVETIWVESKAPARWQVNRAIMVWNRGLTGVQLKAGECQSGSPCIHVTQERVYTPEGESLILGKTSTWFGKKVRFNSNAVGRVSVSDMAYTSCHELGHALGVPHSASKLSCMYPSAKGAAGRPAQADFDAVNGS